MIIGNVRDFIKISLKRDNFREIFNTIWCEKKKKIEDASSNDEKFYKFAEYSCLNIEHSRVTNVDENRNKTMEVSEYESWNNNKLRAFTLKFPVAS